MVENTSAVSTLHELDQASVTRTSVDFAGEVGLVLERKIEMKIDEETPGIGNVGWMAITRDSTVLLTDKVGGGAHEFNLVSGDYIRSFGRIGSGPGEYRSADNVVLDRNEHVYITDRVSAHILRYDRHGQYLDRTRFPGGCQVLTSRGDELYSVRVNRRSIVELELRNAKTWKVLHRTPLSSQKQGFISSYLRSLVMICYNSTWQRLYYLGPNDYRVKEIDAGTNAVIREFGKEPKGYRPLPEKYQGIHSRTDEERRRLVLEMTCLRSMTLIQDRYLLVSHLTLALANISWVVYDLGSEDGIKAYAFNDAASRHLASFGYNNTPVASKGKHLYLWRAPSPEVAERSNGVLEILILTLGAK
ncbi:MAG: 6-bladed beta-propeller [Candidatus Latescibacteria bacterium]|nr:6-bladed beta-propeller [Candidatus Latescibacterota bacterium]